MFLQPGIIVNLLYIGPSYLLIMYDHVTLWNFNFVWYQQLGTWVSFVGLVHSRSQSNWPKFDELFYWRYFLLLVIRLIGIVGGYWGIGWRRSRRPHRLAIPQNARIQKSPKISPKLPKTSENVTKWQNCPEMTKNASKYPQIRALGLSRCGRARPPARP